MLKDYSVMGKLLVAIQSLYENGWERVGVGFSVIFAIDSARLHNTEMVSNRIVCCTILVVHDVHLALRDYCLIASRRVQIL